MYARECADVRKFLLPQIKNTEEAVGQQEYLYDFGKNWVFGYSSDGTTGNPDGSITVSPTVVMDNGMPMTEARLPASAPFMFVRLPVLETAS